MRYKVNFEKAMRECSNSPDFLMKLKSGEYVYVDSYFCLNQPKYVVWDETIAIMTDYARRHKGECCLSVSSETVCTQACKSESKPIRETAAASESKPKNKPKPEYVKISDPKTEQRIKSLNKTRTETTEIFKELSPNLAKTVQSLMAWRHMTVERLAEASGMDERTIRRLRKDPPETEPKLESLIQFCIGLHLPPKISDHVLHVAGKSFTDTELHTAYQLLVYTYFWLPIEDCNILLKGQGFPPLGNSEKIA